MTTHTLPVAATSAALTQPALSTGRTVGVDLAKESFNIAIRDANGTCIEGFFSNTAKGHSQFHSFLRKHHALDALVLMEATGNLYKELAKFLHQQGRRVSVVNPSRIHRFGQSQLKRNKTDPADARLIAQFAMTQPVRLWIPPSPEAEELQSLGRRRGDLVAECTRHKNRLKANPSSVAVRSSLKKQIAFLEDEIAAIEQAIKELLKQHPELDRTVKLLITIPGVAWTTAVTVLAELPELAFFTSARQLAAYAGLTPARSQSGKQEKKSHLSRIGSRRLRTALYMAAVSAIRCNAIVKPFALRLKEHGKPGMTVIAAAMRKLLHIIYGMLKSNRPFDPAFASIGA
ncbi:MAG: IS110 family transposase [Azonexus sp.]